jgi:hypothetical protein
MYATFAPHTVKFSFSYRYNSFLERHSYRPKYSHDFFLFQLVKIIVRPVLGFCSMVAKVLFLV